MGAENPGQPSDSVSPYIMCILIIWMNVSGPVKGWAMKKSAECMFRIAENTNFYLHSRLEKIDIYSGERTIVEICPLRRKLRIG